MTTNQEQQLSWLFHSLDQRKRPEDVADVIANLLDENLTSAEKKRLQKAAKGSLRQNLYGYTAMLQDFARPVGLQKQVAAAEAIFKTAYPLAAEACERPDEVEAFIRHISQEIGKPFGKNDLLDDRLNREMRQATGLEISKRRYNKLFRHLIRMECKLEKLLRELKKYTFTKIGKSGLAHQLDWTAFAADLDTACFIAYYTARCNLRSEFTIYGQQRPFDEIADVLFRRCRANPTTSWEAIAHVYPHQNVLRHLSDEQKGALLGKWFSILQQIASLLAEVWQSSEIKRETMVVQRGNDSTTWNNTANAWNKARDNWIALLYAMGLEDMLQSLCFGKVLRLMAADVVAWHMSVGNGLDPNTFVWNELPLPWEVLAEKETCTLAMVEAACQKHGVDPAKSGWIGPRPRNKVAKYKPTPELVHGVSVENPFLAKTLRDRGFFSGKLLRTQETRLEDPLIHRAVLDQHHNRLTDADNDLE